MSIANSNKYYVEITLFYTDCCIPHEVKFPAQYTYATSVKQAENNVRRRLGKAKNPASNSYDDTAYWRLCANVFEPKQQDSKEPVRLRDSNY